MQIKISNMKVFTLFIDTYYKNTWYSLVLTFKVVESNMPYNNYKYCKF